MLAGSSIEDWKKEGRERGATHLVAVIGVDDGKATFFFIMPGQDPERVMEEVQSRAVRCNLLTLTPTT